MRLVLGLSLTASSAVWVLVDTVNGEILAEEVVALDSLHEIARAAARSVQAFDVQTGHDIEGVRMTWSDDARQHGIRLRTKLRLFGFDAVETVSEDHAREGRNKTARHIAPHLALAYGAARADLDADLGGSVLQRMAAGVPFRVAAAVGAATVVGVGLYAFVGPTPSEAPDTAAAEPVPARSGQSVGPAPAATPPVVPAPQAAEMVAVPVAQPVAVPEPADAWQPITTAVEPEADPAPEIATEIALDSTVPETISAIAGEPHLPAVQQVAEPGQVVEPVMTVPEPVLPPPLPPVLSSLFGALP